MPVFEPAPYCTMWDHPGPVLYRLGTPAAPYFTVWEDPCGSVLEPGLTVWEHPRARTLPFGRTQART